MDITRAFPLDSPRIDVPWGLSEHGFLDLLRDCSPQKVTNGHYHIRCRFFGLAEADLHFHFHPRTGGALTQIEFYRRPQRHKKKAFDELQRTLEVHLGAPTERGRLAFDGVQPALWRFGKVTVSHEYYYQSGQNEKIVFATRAA